MDVFDGKQNLAYISALLEAMCAWTLANFTECRDQHLTSLVLSLAAVHYHPKNWEQLLEKVRLRFNQTSTGLPELIWLDLAWSLAVLGDSNSAFTVLNDTFIDKIPGR